MVTGKKGRTSISPAAVLSILIMDEGGQKTNNVKVISSSDKWLLFSCQDLEIMTKHIGQATNKEMTFEIEISKEEQATESTDGCFQLL